MGDVYSRFTTNGQPTELEVGDCMKIELFRGEQFAHVVFAKRDGGSIYVRSRENKIIIPGADDNACPALVELVSICTGLAFRLESKHESALEDSTLKRTFVFRAVAVIV